MAWQQLVMDVFLRISRDCEQVLDGLDTDELHQQPFPNCNTIAWLIWHLTRSHDRNISELAGEEQLWITEGWYTEFNRPPDPNETGFGHSAEEAAAFRAPGGRAVVDYHRAVVERIQHYILHTMTEDDLDRDAYSPTFGDTMTVRRRLVGIISEGLQHVGQAAYGRGALRGHGWLGR